MMTDGINAIERYEVDSKMNRLILNITYKFLKGEDVTKEIEELETLPKGYGYPSGKKCVYHLNCMFLKAEEFDKFEVVAELFARGGFTAEQLRQWANDEIELDFSEFGIKDGVKNE